MAARRFILWALLAAPLATGCAGEGPPTSATPTSTTTTIDGSSGALADIQRDIFNPSCATLGCHDPLSQAGALVLSDVATSFAELVGVTSQCGVSVLVVAGQPHNSYLLDKLGRGSSTPCGSLMPLGRPDLTGTEIQAISDWISSGAPAAALVLTSSTTSSSTSTSSTSSSSSTSSTSTTTLHRALQARE